MNSKGADHFTKYYEYLFKLQSILGERLDQLLGKPNGVQDDIMMWKYLEMHQKLAVYFQGYDWEKETKIKVFNNTFERIYTREQELYFYHKIEGKELKLTINNTLNEVTIEFLTGPQQQSIAYIYAYINGKWELNWTNVPVTFL